MKGFAQCQRAYDNEMPDDNEGECPECGSDNVEDDGKYRAECLDCGWYSESDLLD